MSGEDEDADKKGFRLLGILDVQNVPCARESLLYGTGGALAVGLLHFLATSRVRRSYDLGFAGFIVTTLGSWFYCRINNAKLRVQERVIQQGIRNKVVYQGTSLDPNKQPEGPPILPEGPPILPEGPPKLPEGPPKLPEGPPILPEGPPKQEQS